MSRMMRMQMCLGLIAGLLVVTGPAWTSAADGETPSQQAKATDEGQAKPVKAAPALLYRQAGVMMLQVSKPIEFSVLNTTAGSSREVIVTAQLPAAAKTAISGSSKPVGDQGNVLNSLKIALKEKLVINDKASIDSLSLNVETTLIKNISYWKITGMSVDYVATVGGVKYQAEDEAVWVDKVPGFTRALVDLNCQRGYSSCAPSELSWTCDQQDFRSKKLDASANDDDNDNEGHGAELLFPGLQIQPFGYPMAEDGKFGFNWDCDPLLSTPLWTSLLLGLLLILFLFWSCDMIASLNTPDRFDDAKGPQIMVPNTD